MATEWSTIISRHLTGDMKCAIYLLCTVPFCALFVHVRNFVKTYSGYGQLGDYAFDARQLTREIMLMMT